MDAARGFNLVTTRTADVAILGGGLIGRSAALACLQRGLSVTLFDARRPGESSPAGAGMLAPAIEHDGSPAEQLAVIGRDLWPGYLQSVAALSRIPVALNRAGILVVAADAAGTVPQRARLAPTARWLETGLVSALEPGVHAPYGAVLHPLDGAVDNGALLAALDDALSRQRALSRVGPARSIERAGEQVAVLASDGTRVVAGRAVIALGAWAPQLAGLPRPLPVEPVRGEMLGYPAAATAHVLYGTHAYVVPRPGGRVIVGATMDRVGFDASTTASARAQLHAAVGDLLPALRTVEPDAHWAGLRPVTPDFLPILGAEPEWPAVMYATGHSRNGILLAPLTAEVVSHWAMGEPVIYDLTPFNPARFGNLLY